MIKRVPILTVYNESVDWFETHRGQSLFEKKYLDLLIEQIPKGSAVLDLGCGFGKPIASYFIVNGFNVTGVDGSENMIARAQSLQPQSRWIVADMRTLNLNEKFSALIAWNSFFHLNHDEQRNMFEIFSNHLAPQGVLLFTSGPDFGVALGELNGFELYHASLSTAEYNKLLQHNGFTVLTHQIEDPQCGNHTVWLARKN